MANADFIAGYHAGYKAALAHLNDVPGLVLPGNVAAMLSDDARRNGLAESAAAEQHTAPLIESDAVLMPLMERPSLGEVERDAESNPTELGTFIGKSAAAADGTDHEPVAVED